jgi:phosphopantothenoylcysteine decarboxylase / phosphopantothenate---cysteine ligase
MILKDKTIVLGVTGSIAAYKAADLASQLTKAGSRVEVIMTDAGEKFINPLTFRNITGRPVVTTMWELSSEYSVEHIALADAADIIVIAPATANTIAKLVAGMADNMLTSTVLATNAPVILAPAMDANMFENTITQENITKLRERGFIIVGPESGWLASGKSGIGRFVDTNQIMGTICKILGQTGDLAGKRIVITAGGTKEPIDPVRCLTNYSSGKMGYALAEASRDRGADVVLVTAPTSLSKPAGMEIIPVETAQEMFDAVANATVRADALIMAAAVADFRPSKISKRKIKRQGTNTMSLELEKTPDILNEVKGSFIRIGFAAESDNLIANAKDKLQKKKLDLIVANDITLPDSGIGSDNNQVVIIDNKGDTEELPLLPKSEVADEILDRLITLFE